jgi:hypothetical protein
MLPCYSIPVTVNLFTSIKAQMFYLVKSPQIHNSQNISLLRCGFLGQNLQK